VPSTAVPSEKGIDRDATWFRAFLFGIAAVGPFSLNIVNPCLPFIREEFHASRASVQWSASLSILAAAFATLLAGPISDRVGRRPVLGTSLALYAVASVVCASSTSVELLVVGRVVQAATSSIALVTARATIHDVFGDEHSTRVIARVSLFAVLAVVFAPILGGLLIESMSWRAVFGLTAIVGAALFAVSVARVPETMSARPAATADRPRLAALVRSPTFHGFAMQSSLHFATFFAFTSTATYLMVEALGRPATAYGLWFVLLSVFVGAGLLSAERLSARFGAGQLAALGSFVALVGTGAEAISLSTFPLGPAVLFLPICVAAFGIGLAVPATNAGVMSAVPRLAGTASGWMGFQQYLFAACFAQLAASDERRTPSVLAGLCLAGCAFAAASSLLSYRPATGLGLPALEHDGTK